MPDAVIIGGGGHARVLAEVLARLGYGVLGFTAPTSTDLDRRLPYLGTDDQFISRLDPNRVVAILGIGKTRCHDERLKLMDRLERAGLQFPAIVASSSTVHSDVVLREGSVVMDGAVVATGSQLGRGCIVNTNATIDHDCRIGDGVHVAPGATISGDVEVGDGCMIGAGATIIHSVRIGNDCLIGAGATVVGDIDQAGVYVGTPARRRTPS